MEIRQILENKKDFLDLLLLADEQEDMVDRYLELGDMYVAFDTTDSSKEKDSFTVIGECVVCKTNENELEIKNMAIKPAYQKKGYGRLLIAFVEERYRNDCKKLKVGTGDSPLTLPFYEKCGFKETHRLKGFFTENYDHPIVEAGIKLVDMVYLSKNL